MLKWHNRLSRMQSLAQLSLNKYYYYYYLGDVRKKAFAKMGGIGSSICSLIKQAFKKMWNTC